MAGLDDVGETGVEVDMFAAHGPDDVDAVLPGHAGDVTQAGVVLLLALRIETRGVEMTSPVIGVHQATQLAVTSDVETLNTKYLLIFFLAKLIGKQ